MHRYVKVLLIAFFFSFLVILFYSFVAPDPIPSVGFLPLPNLTPGSIIPSTTSSQCNTEGVECTADIDCEACGGGFSCTPIDPDKNVLFNGTVLKPGNSYCLPKIEGNPNSCGTYTGRAVYTETPGGAQFPKSEAQLPKSGAQRWDCLCLYPSFFGGKDCTEQLACKVIDKDGGQPGDQRLNRLISRLPSGTGAAPLIYDSHSPPPNNLPPYAVDSDGNPAFECECGGVYGSKGFTKLPGDPYRCHINPCTPLSEAGNKDVKWDPAVNSCNCGDYSSTRLIKSNVDGMCRLDTCSLYNGTDWNPTSGICNCASIDSKGRECNSAYYSRPGTTRKCADTTNTVGYECFKPCDSVDCGNGECLVDDTQPEGYKCQCSQGARLVSEGEKKSNKCQPCKAKNSDCNLDSDCCNGNCKYVSQSVGGPGGTSVVTPSNSTCIDPSSGGFGCFIKGSTVLLSSGETKPIEELTNGDKIYNYGYSVVTVGEDKVTQSLGSQALYGFNNFKPFVTGGHVFYGPEGPLAIDPSLTMKENVLIRPGKLQVGSIIFESITFSSTSTSNSSGGGENDEVTNERVYKPYTINKITSILTLPVTTKTYGLYISNGDSYHITPPGSTTTFVVGAQYPKLTITYIKEGLKRLSETEREKTLKYLRELEPELNKLITPGVVGRIVNPLSV